jgi:hypothetical protein
MIWLFVHPLICLYISLTALSALMIYCAVKFRSGLAATWAFASAFPVLMFVYGSMFDRHEYVLFANDGPFGAQVHQWPWWQYFTGAWADLNSIGVSTGGGFPNEANTLFVILFIVGVTYVFETDKKEKPLTWEDVKRINAEYEKEK